MPCTRVISSSPLQRRKVFAKSALLSSVWYALSFKGRHVVAVKSFSPLPLRQSFDNSKISFPNKHLVVIRLPSSFFVRLGNGS